MKNKNTISFILYKFFANCALFVPIVVIFLKARTHSSAQAFSIIGIYSLTIMLAEVPTGVMADYFGVKRILLVGILFAIIGSLTMGFGKTYVVLVMGEILIALSTSLRSGADSALLFGISSHSLTVYKKMEGLAVSVKYVALCVSSLAGSFLYAINKSMPFVVSGVMYAASLVFVLFISTKGSNYKYEEAKRLNFITIKILFGKAKLILIIILTASIAGIFSTVYWFIQPYLQSIGIKETLFGAIYAASFIVSALGSFVSGKIKYNKRTNVYQIFVLGMAGAAIPLSLYFIRNVFGITFLIVNQFLIGFSYPVFFSALQNIAPENLRATVLSMESLLQRLFLTSVIFVVSILIPARGFFGTTLIADIIFIAIFAGVSTVLLSLRLN